MTAVFSRNYRAYPFFTIFNRKFVKIHTTCYVFVILNKYDCNKVRDRSIAAVKYMHVSKIQALLHYTLHVV